MPTVLRSIGSPTWSSLCVLSGGSTFLEACCHLRARHTNLGSCPFFSCWLGFIIVCLYDLYLFGGLGLAKFMAWVEMAIVFVLSVFGYTVTE